MSMCARPAGVTFVILASFVLIALPALAEDLDCLECHDDVEFTSTAHPDVACGDCHSTAIRTLSFAAIPRPDPDAEPGSTVDKTA